MTDHYCAEWGSGDGSSEANSARHPSELTIAKGDRVLCARGSRFGSWSPAAREDYEIAGHGEWSKPRPLFFETDGTQALYLVNGKRVKFSELQFTGGTYGLYINASDECLVKSCHFNDATYPISLIGGSHVVSDCPIDEAVEGVWGCVIGRPTSGSVVRFVGCRFTHSSGTGDANGGLAVYSGVTDGAWIAEDCVFMGSIGAVLGSGVDATMSMVFNRCLFDQLSTNALRTLSGCADDAQMSAYNCLFRGVGTDTATDILSFNGARVTLVQNTFVLCPPASPTNAQRALYWTGATKPLLLGNMFVHPHAAGYTGKATYIESSAASYPGLVGYGNELYQNASGDDLFAQNATPETEAEFAVSASDFHERVMTATVGLTRADGVTHGTLDGDHLDNFRQQDDATAGAAPNLLEQGFDPDLVARDFSGRLRPSTGLWEPGAFADRQVY